MESGDRAAEELTSTPQERESSPIAWARHAAVSTVLVAIAFIQSPGLIASDTKIDLLISPTRFMARALRMWDPQGFFGQVQNQAYGYLFPMGPFHAILTALDVPAWVVQRSWWALILVVSYLGFVLLARALGIGSLTAQVVAGFLFALSPRVLSVMGPSSIEVWPGALAAWVLLPLVIGLQRGEPRRYAVLSAALVGCVGGVNAVATFAVIPLAAWWLLVQPRGPRWRVMVLWWPPLVAAACAWWLGALFLLGVYSPPFLDYIESASVTTTAATVVDALRGTTNWLPYISETLPGGRSLLTDPVVILNSGLVVVAGLVGLTLPRLRHRGFLTSGLLLGLVLVTLGHVGSVSGLAAAEVQELLDGVLAPLRNTHKFDVIIRLPLLLGLCHAVTLALRATAGAADLVARTGVVLTVASCLVGAVLPAWSGRIAPSQAMEQIPGYWEDAVAWLDSHSEGTALLVPSSSFATYLWGTLTDEPIQPLATSAWAVRNNVPLTPPGTIRLLDAVTDQLSGDTAGEGLADALGRAGVTELVVRNDLRTDVDAARAQTMRSTLLAAPGIELAATFGPAIGGTGLLDLDQERLFADGGWQQNRPAVEIYRVEPQRTIPDRQLVSQTPTVVGDAGSLFVTDALGWTTGRRVLTGGDAQSLERRPSGPLIVTDGLRRQETTFGSVDRQRSATLAPDEPYRATRPVHDYLDPADERWVATAEVTGVRAIRASSSEAWAGTVGGVRPGRAPASAFDGDVRTSWVATDAAGWLRVDLAATVDTRVRLVTHEPRGVRQRFEVRTRDGWESVDLDGSADAIVEVGEVDRIHVRGTRLSPGRLSLAEVEIEDVSVFRTLAIPPTPATWGTPDAMVFGLDPGRRTGCLEVVGVTRCRAGVEERGESAFLLDRTVSLDGAADYEISGMARPLGSDRLDRELQGEGARVSASSTVNQDARASATMAVDGDLSTAWIADPDDDDPTLTVTLPEPRSIDALTLRTDRRMPASRVERATLIFDDGSQRRVVLEDGQATFDAVRASSVEIHLTSREDARDSDAFGFSRPLPVGVSEMSIGSDPGPSRRLLDRHERPFSARCGLGPTLEIDGTRVRTRIRATVGEVATGRAVPFEPCDGQGTVRLGAGRVNVVASASESFTIERLALESVAGVPSGTVDPSEGVLLSTGHNSNPGWVAQADGRRAPSVRADGWQQAWVVPHAAEPSITFAPAGTYRNVLRYGFAAALLLPIVFAVPRRRPLARTRALDAGPRRWVLALVSGIALTLVGGPVAAALAGVAVLAALAWRPTAVVAPWVAGGAASVSIAAYVLKPWGATGAWIGDAAWPQWASLVALAAVVAAGLARDMAGRST